MSEAKKIYNTDDPILLEALNAPEIAARAAEAKRKKNGDSPYRGISKKGKGDQWRCEVGAGGKDYAVGYYQSDHEAALARNYAESLIPGAKKVNNLIPPEHIPPEVQKKVAAEVVSRLRGYGLLPPVERNGEHTPEVAVEPATAPAQRPQQEDDEAVKAALEKTKKEIIQMAMNARKGA